MRQFTCLPVKPRGQTQVNCGGGVSWPVVTQVAPFIHLWGCMTQASPTYWQNSPVQPGAQTHYNTQKARQHLSLNILFTLNVFIHKHFFFLIQSDSDLAIFFLLPIHVMSELVGIRHLAQRCLQVVCGHRGSDPEPFVCDSNTLTTATLACPLPLYVELFTLQIK